MGVIIKEIKDGILTIEKENGTTFDLTENEAWELKIQLMLHGLKEDIHELVDYYDGEFISLGSFDGTQEEFEKKVYARLSGDVECGDYPSDDYAEEIVTDLAKELGIWIDD